MKKKMLSFLLALVMALSLMPTLALVEAHADTCQHQWTEHGYCVKCEEISSDHTHVMCEEYGYCTLCGYTTAKHKHVVVENMYSRDEAGHSQECAICAETIEGSFEAHHYNANGICTVCGYGKDGHKHEAMDKLHAYDYQTHEKLCRYCFDTIAGSAEAHNYVHGRCTGCGRAADAHEHVFKYIEVVGGDIHERYCALCFEEDVSTAAEHTPDAKGICTVCGALTQERETQIRAMSISCDSAKRLLLNLTMADGEKISTVVEEFDTATALQEVSDIFENGKRVGEWYGGIIRTDKLMLNALWMVRDDGSFCVETLWGVTSNTLKSCEYYDVYTAATKEYGVADPQITYAGGMWTVTGQAYDGQEMYLTIQGDKTEVHYSKLTEITTPAVKPSYVGASGKPYVYWSAVAGASKYEVYRSDSKTGTYTRVGTVTKLNFTDSTAQTGTTYFYKVKAVSADGVASDYSTPVTITCRCARPVGKSDYWASTGKPYIKWDAVDGAGKYYVYRSTSKDGSYQYIGSATKTNYTDSTAVAGTTYYYKVKAISSVQSAANSAYSTAVTITCRCARPVGKSDYWASTGKPYIKWDAVDGAGKYYVYRSTSKDGSYQYIGSATKTNYTDSTAVAGTTYYYKVKAVSSVQSAANSSLSTAVTITCRCARPVGKSDYWASTGKPYIKWDAVDGAGKYYVYRSTSKDGSYQYIGSTTKTNYTDSTAVAGTTYYYKVKAISSVQSAANSSLSTAVTITCRCARPSVKITTTSAGKPKLTWNAVTGASKYEIYRATSKNGTYTKMYTTTALSYTNTSAKAGTTYYYKVKAISKVRSTANSSFSTVVSIKAK